MKITILTLFPEMFSGPFDHSIIKKAKEKKLLEVNFVNIRDFGLGKHKVVDDKPFGGGVGMVMRVDVLDKAIQSARNGSKNEQVVLTDARGEKFKQEKAMEFSKLDHLILVCGHYEGVDERVRSLVDQTVSIGDFILTGGEIPAIVIIDAVGRLITGVLKQNATELESFAKDKGLLEYPQYTQPREYDNITVPDVLISGDHKQIQKWKEEKSLEITKKHRPDLL